MTKSVSEKLGIKQDMRAMLIHEPEHFTSEIHLPEVQMEVRLAGEFDYIHVFVHTQKQFHDIFKDLKTHLKPNGFIWVSWPKSRQENTDLNIKKVIEIGYDYGLVESKAISINSLWSALKFTHPIKGKVYNNSYGTLKIDDLGE